MNRNRNTPKNQNLLRIGQLAKKAGVTIPTIKHYVKQGLLPKPMKTSRNMAYYDESCVEKINAIKRLQKEKYLPLHVIRRLIDSETSYDEELELGRAILKSRKEPGPNKWVKGSQVAQVTGFPLEKIVLLEENGLIFPETRNNIKYYDAVDLEVIDLMKRREELGLPFHLSLETIRIYRDCISSAVYGDIQLFVNNFIGDIPTRTAIRFLTEADAEIDRFMALFRHKMLRSFSENAIKEMNQLPEFLLLLNIFPVKGRDLPASPPRNIYFRTIYYLCLGDYDAIVALANAYPRGKTDPGIPALSILSSLLKGNIDELLSMVEQYVPKPSTRVLDNTIAALAYVFSIGKATGLSTPMHHTKKVVGYLRPIENATETNPLFLVFSEFVRGSIYTVLPEVVQTRRKGIAILEKLKASINARKIKTGRLPGWLVRTLDFELFPALQIRIKRFLAEAYLKEKQPGDAIACLEKIIEISDPGSEHLEWARMKRLHIQPRLA